MTRTRAEGRGFDSPPEGAAERLGGRGRAWALLGANRIVLSFALSAIVFVVLLGVTQLPGVDLLAAMSSSDPVETLFQALVGSIITGVTIVVTITQLVLSQELGPLGDQRQRMDGAMDFRSRVEELLEVPAAPPEPSAFLRAMVERIDQHATHLRHAAADELGRGEVGDRPAWEEVLDYCELVLDNSGRVADDLDGAQFGTFAVVSAALGFDYSWLLYLGRRLFHDEDSPLRAEEHAELRDELERVLDLLALFGPAREHIKTLYFEWELIDLSRQILTLAGPALLVSVAALLLLDSPGPPAGTTLGVEDAVWLVVGATTIAVSPFVLLTSYILRVITVAKLTLAAGPFILRRTDRRHDIDWSR